MEDYASYASFLRLEFGVQHIAIAEDPARLPPIESQRSTHLSRRLPPNHVSCTSPIKQRQPHPIFSSRWAATVPYSSPPHHQGNCIYRRIYSSDSCPIPPKRQQSVPQSITVDDLDDLVAVDKVSSSTQPVSLELIEGLSAGRMCVPARSHQPPRAA
jgi:hypothetical protein